LKETRLQRWCDQAWLYAVYLLGIIMGNVLLIQWSAWGIPQRFMCLLAIMIPLHVFEENTLPGGFFYMNNLERKSPNPLAYPQSRLTNMITNLGAEIFVVILTAFAAHMGLAPVFAAIFFGIGETVFHTIGSPKMLERYRHKGKTTIYAPGLITSWICLLPLSVYGSYWIYEQGNDRFDLLGGLGILLFIMVFLIAIPLGISGRAKSTKYAFPRAYYFDKYEPVDSIEEGQKPYGQER